MSMSGDRRRGESREEVVEAIEAVVHALLHPALDHGVASLDRLVDGVVADRRLAVTLLEHELLERDVPWGTLELEGLEHAVRRLLAMEDPVEAPGIALVVAVDEAPRAAVTRLPAVDRH